MPEIEISADQRATLDDLRSELAERHVGEYGAVRYRDALQFLLDRHEAGDLEEADAAETGGDHETTEDAEDAGEGGDGGSDDEGADGPGRLQAMMRLLDDHEDKWEEADTEQGKYAVTLPDGETEHVRTKDDVRGLLFKHYS